MGRWYLKSELHDGEVKKVDEHVCYSGSVSFRNGETFRFRICGRFGSVQQDVFV